MIKPGHIHLLFFLGFIFSPTNLLGQILKQPQLNFETTFQYSTDGQPTFWLMSNRFGKFDLADKTALLGIKAQTEELENVLWDVNYGIELLGGMGGAEDLWIHQAWLMVDYHKLIRFRAGWMEETFGNSYDPLSSGGIIWSANARPMPKVEIGTAGFVEVPFTQGLFEIKGSLAHGWFESGRYVENVWLHQKYAAARTKLNFPLNVYFAFHHFAQWGGDHPGFGQLPINFDSFVKVFFVQQGDEQSPGSWQINRFGNHLGSRNYGLNWEHQTHSVSLYLQDVFEDGSGGRKKNYPDGLWGISWVNNRKDRYIHSIVFEYLQTTHQSGPFHDPEMGLSGNDNYFNHIIYQSGWTLNRMTIGTPFITSPFFNKSIEHPLNMRIWNNRVLVYHLGIQGSVPFPENINYRALLSYSLNKGVYGSPELITPEVFDFEGKTRQHFSWLLGLKTKTPLPGLDAELLLSGDRGEMYGNNLGFSFSLSFRIL